MINLKIAAAALMFIAAALTPVSARDVLFLGVTGVRGDPTQPELESELRAELAADKRFRLVGAVETERVVREMERQGRTRADAAVPPSAGLSDSTVIVRGVVKEFSITAKRSPWLIWGKIDAKMRIEVSFGELSGKSFHRGEFGAAASKRKEVVLFRDPKKVVHVSAVDREELLGRMRADLVKDVIDLADIFFNALLSGGALPFKTAKDSADAGGAGGSEYSTPDGKDVAPIDGAEAPEGGR